MNRTSLRYILGLTFFLNFFSAVHADVVIDWNGIASDTLLQDTFYQNPGMASRNMAMMNLAIYDTVNGINPTHQQFYSHAPAPTNVSTQAAVIQSAYRVLSSSYPSQQSFLQTQRVNSLSAIPDTAAKAAGIAYGDMVGTNVVNIRNNDGYDDMVNYTPQGGAGHWEPDPLNPTQEAWGPAWGALQPFSIPDTSAVLPPAMKVFYTEFDGPVYGSAFSNPTADQGYHFSKPLPAREMAVRLTELETIRLSHYANFIDLYSSVAS